MEEYDPNAFPKGTYVVMEHTCSVEGGNWKDSMPEHYCYLLREDSTTVYVMMERDLKGSKNNGWRSGSPDTTHKYLKLRRATPREIARYQELGMPFDVRTLPKDEIINQYSIY